MVPIEPDSWRNMIDCDGCGVELAAHEAVTVLPVAGNLAERPVLYCELCLLGDQLRRQWHELGGDP